MTGEAPDRILIVEDNFSLARGLSHALETEGYRIEHVARGDLALDRLRRGGFDLAILDLMLPGISGFDVLRSLRERGDDTPVLVLSARGEDVDKIQGFRLGADDYVVKPVGLVELLLRAGAILRRSAPRDPDGAPLLRWRFGEVEVDERTRIVTRKGEPVELSRLEFDLLAALLRAEGRAVPREELLRRVWGIRRPARVRTRTIDTHIAALRSKLEPDAPRPRYILTVRKVGYRLEPAPRGDGGDGE